MTESGREIHTYFLEHKADFIKLLRSLVEQETPSDDPSSFKEVFSILRKNFEDLDYDVEHRQGKTTAGELVCKPENFDPDAPNQLLVGHIDTVWGTGTLNEMPFSIENNIVKGPGTFDMKAGVCMMIFAMKAIRELGRSPDVQPVFIISSDEEIGSFESKEVIVEEAKQAERTFILEPALGREGKIKTERKGIGLYEIDIKGTPSHAGLDPEKGSSAILALSNIVQQLIELNDPLNGINVNIGKIEGGERANVIAAKSKAIVDVRVPSKEDGERINKQIYNLKSEEEGIEVKISGGIRRLPLEKKEANQQLWEITQSLGRELDMELEETATGGVSDGNFTNLYSPTIDGLGAVGEGAHAYHEKIFLDETLKRAELLTLLLLHPSFKMNPEA